jgi:hypothetical protein
MAEDPAAATAVQLSLEALELPLEERGAFLDRAEQEEPIRRRVAVKVIKRGMGTEA